LLQRLSRVTSTGRFVPEIDGLRFMAIMAVVLFHIQKHVFPAWTDFAGLGATCSTAGEGAVIALRGVINTGWIGVQLFFIISGFILSTPFAEHHLTGASAPTLGKYFVRRVTRLEPPYIINLLLLYGLTVWLSWYCVSGGSGKSAGELAPHLLASLLYSHNIAYGDHSLINNVAWTLEIEVQFYILAPLLATVFCIRRKRLRRAVIVGGIVAGCLFGHWRADLGNDSRLAYVLGMTLLGQFKYFLIGFLLADVYLVEWKKAPPTDWRWDVVGLAAWLAIPFMIPTYVPWLDGAWGALHAGWRFEYMLPAVMLVAYIGAFRGRVLNLFFRYPWVTAIGGMCYTIYLYHNSVIFFTYRYAGGLDLGLGEGINALSRGAILIAAVVTVGSLLFVLFERPFMNRHWPRWVWQQARAVVGHVAVAIRGGRFARQYERE
jgi:peptidoglycan/LPS O-acetylase OafA/YrhL